MTVETHTYIRLLDQDGKEVELLVNIEATIDPGRPARYTMPPSKGVPEPPSIDTISTHLDETGEVLPWAIAQHYEEQITSAIWDTEPTQ